MADRIASGNAGIKELAVADVDGESNDERVNPMATLEQLADVGGFKAHLADIGRSIRVRRLEGRSLAGLVGNYVFTGAPGTGKVVLLRRIYFGFAVLIFLCL